MSSNRTGVKPTREQHARRGRDPAAMANQTGCVRSGEGRLPASQSDARHACSILCLDLATKTGWAHSDGASGVQDFTPRRGDSPGMRWLEFKAWLNRLLDASPADVIAYEQAHHRGGAPTHVAHSLISCVEQVAAERGIELTNRHSATIKKHALGKGRGGKDAMLIAAFEKGWCPQDDNECDALWLLDLMQMELR